MNTLSETNREERPNSGRSTLPVNLLLDGKKTLVVGAGKVATRKVQQLVEAGARVTVVGETAVPAIWQLHEAGAIRLKERPFAARDVAGMLLVFAATNDGEANGRVLRACRQRGVMCGCVDQRWQEGDLISPAVARAGDLTVAVSTGGRSCRHARRVRDVLARHLAGVNTSDLLVLGTGHERLPLPRLEPLLLTDGRLERMARRIGRIRGIEEFLLLSTCNRVELLAVASDDEADLEVARQMLGLETLAPREWYLKRGFDAFAHTALLAAGLLSQTPGESHIVAQIKGALSAAADHGWSGGLLQDWISRAFCLGREIRGATRPLLRGGDVEDWVIRYLASERAAFRDRAGIVIGAGAVGTRLVERILALPGRGSVCWIYRNRKPALPPAWRERVRLLDVTHLTAALPGADYLVAAAGGAAPVVHDAHRAPLARAGRLLMIDTGMPRNIDPAVAARVKGGRLVDLETLKTWCGVRAGGMAEALRLGHEKAIAGREIYEKLRQTF